MTVQSQISRITQNGDGVTVTFPVSFYFLSNDDLTVIVDGVTKTITTDYTVTGAGNPAGGSVTFTTAPASGTGNVIIFRDPDLTQLLDYIENDDFPAESHERGLDKLTMIAQRINDLVSRSVRVSDSAPGTFSPLTPTTDGSLPLIGFTPGGTGIQLYPLSGAPGDASNIVYTPAGTGAVATTVENQLRFIQKSWINVKDAPFYAIGDGVADDTAAIQAAIDSTVNGTLFFPSGVYRITDTLIWGANPISIQGTRKNTVIFWDGVLGGDMFLLNGTRMSFKDLVLDGNEKALHFFKTEYVPGFGNGVFVFESIDYFDGDIFLETDTQNFVQADMHFFSVRGDRCDSILVTNRSQNVNFFFESCTANFFNDTLFKFKQGGSFSVRDLAVGGAPLILDIGDGATSNNGRNYFILDGIFVDGISPQPAILRMRGLGRVSITNFTGGDINAAQTMPAIEMLGPSGTVYVNNSKLSHVHSSAVPFIRIAGTNINSSRAILVVENSNFFSDSRAVYTKDEIIQVVGNTDNVKYEFNNCVSNGAPVPGLADRVVAETYRDTDLPAVGTQVALLVTPVSANFRLTEQTDLIGFTFNAIGGTWDASSSVSLILQRRVPSVSNRFTTTISGANGRSQVIYFSRLPSNPGDEYAVILSQGAGTSTAGVRFVIEPLAG